MRIAAIGDLHFRTRDNEELESIFRRIEGEADVLLLAGDLTDSGLPAEMDALLNATGKIRLPIVAVLGNHDHENDRAEDLHRMMTDQGIHVLNGTTFEFSGVGFVGTKGFCGGFGPRVVQPFGERLIKQFVQGGIDESTRLKNGLAELKTSHKVALLHYSPAVETLSGEPPEIYAFLGTSWLGDAIDLHGADFALHGHAHQGSPEGRTPKDIPVYNVSRFVRQRISPRPYLLIEI